jgi:hypothetical protein
VSAQTASGVLELQCDPGKLTVRREVEIVARLSTYAGAPITTCQFWVISTGSARIRTVDRGAGLPEQDGWNFRYSVHPASAARNGSYIDTALVVFWGPRGLVNSPPQKIALVGIDVPAGSSGNVRIHNVMAAVATGDDAGIRTGKELVLARSPK